MRSTPLRLTAILVAIFSFASLAGFGIAYRVMLDNFDEVSRHQIEESLASYQAYGDDYDLRQRLLADVSTTNPETVILQYIADDGTRISNVRRFPEVSGLSIVPVKDVGADLDDETENFLALDGRVGAGTLVVALTREQVSEMGEIFSTVFLVSLLPALAIAAIIGLLMAGRARDRIDEIRDALGDLTGGRLQTRISVDPSSVEDLDQIALAVNAMAKAQEASVASLKQVSADIAHDLKSPIQRVAVLLDRLARKTGLTPDQAAIVGSALAETDGIVKSFQALLQIAQIEGGGVQDRFAEVSLNHVVEDIVDVYAPAAEESGHSLDLVVTGRKEAITKGDRHLLAQVLANLIENSIRYVPSGGSIGVNLDTEGRVLSVLDDGPGIPEDERENVLRRLYRLERSRTSEGSGLGLSLVAAICELHGARLTLGANHPGLAVRIEFPPSV